MTNTSGGGGSNHNRRNGTPKTTAPVYHPTWSGPDYKPGSGYSLHKEVQAAQRDNRRKFGEEAYNPEGKRRRTAEQVKKADAAAAANRKKAAPAKKAPPAKKSTPRKK